MSTDQITITDPDAIMRLREVMKDQGLTRPEDAIKHLISRVLELQAEVSNAWQAAETWEDLAHSFEDGLRKAEEAQAHQEPEKPEEKQAPDQEGLVKARRYECPKCR